MQVRGKRSVGDLPAYRGLCKGGFGCDLTGDGAGHFGEGGLDVVAEGPDGDLLHGVAVGDGGLFEAVVDGDRREVVDAGDLAVAVAETWSVTGAGRSDSVTADVDA